MRAKIRHRANGQWYLSTIGDDGTEDAHGGFRTQREAKARSAELIADAARGRYVTPGRLTVADYLLGEWLEARRTTDTSPVPVMSSERSSRHGSCRTSGT
jgi:hypothetical protein